MARKIGPTRLLSTVHDWVVALSDLNSVDNLTHEEASRFSDSLTVFLNNLSMQGMNKLEQLCEGVELLKLLVINLVKKVSTLESKVSGLKKELTRLSKELSQWKSEVMVGELASIVEKKILRSAFEGIPGVNLDFVSINHLTPIMNHQRGPDLPKLTFEQVKLMKENMKAMHTLFKPNDSMTIFGTIRQLKHRRNYAAHPDLETLKAELPGLPLDSSTQERCELLWSVLTKLDLF